MHQTTIPSIGRKWKMLNLHKPSLWFIFFQLLLFIYWCLYEFWQLCSFISLTLYISFCFCHSEIKQAKSKKKTHKKSVMHFMTFGWPSFFFSSQISFNSHGMISTTTTTPFHDPPFLPPKSMVSRDKMSSWLLPPWPHLDFNLLTTPPLCFLRYIYLIS